MSKKDLFYQLDGYLIRFTLILFLAVITSACAYTTTKRVDYTSKEDGFRIYDPLPLLIVTCTNVQLISIPDFTRGYIVEFGAVLAKNNSNIKLSEGLATELSANLDDTALLSLLQGWGEKAIENVKDLTTLGAQVPGTLPGMEGIWLLEFGATGQLVGMKQIQKGNTCPSTSTAPNVVPQASATITAHDPKPPVNFP
jgi:hypothetical protein